MTTNESNAGTSALLQLSIATGDATSMDEVAALLSRTAAPLVGAANAAIGVVANNRSALQIFQGPTATAGNAPIRILDLEEITPMTDAVRKNQSVVVGTEEFTTLYPRIAARTSVGDVAEIAAFPLQLNGETLGGCFFRFAAGGDLDQHRLPLMEQLLPVLARAIARIQDRAELVAYARRLEQSNRDLDNFAAVVAHDLSAPVRRIGSYLQLLERELAPLPTNAARYSTIIQDQVQHLHLLLRDTLAYAQVVAPTDTRQHISLETVLHETMQALEPVLTSSNATTTVGPLPVLDVEVTLVRQVFENLFDNALKYRHVDRDPAIEIGAEREPREPDTSKTWWKIRFADNGIGIDPARYDEVFAMFARLENTDDRPGTGVGLAFVKRVVERHGGTIGVGPSAHGGTTFWFTLPGPVEHDVL